MPSNPASISCTLHTLLIGILLLLSSCDTTPDQHTTQGQNGPKRELLVYCGITMVQPTMELATLVEKEKNCTIKVSYGESEWLKATAVDSKTGDILFPGAPSYLQSMIEDGSINKTVTVGENRIALIVQKGNPKQVRPDLHELLREDLQIVIGAADSGSIGRETFYSLKKLDIYEQAITKALYLTADSKGLSQALHSKDADLVVNWRAVATFKDNKQFMDVLPLPDAQTETHPLVMGLLSYSKHKDLAEYFLQRAGSESGQEIFSRYGF
ncbi:MAG: molybdate transport system substrate-binding [Desulfobulbaceae bacterium]|nr:MAG: molybdate transport system substrate-binding [Desulfobulbaceae bacterium]